MRGTSRFWGTFHGQFLLAQIPKEQKIQPRCKSFFALSESARIKNASKTLMRLTLGGKTVKLLKQTRFSWSRLSAILFKKLDDLINRNVLTNLMNKFEF